jgi:hypothetical protein
MPIILAGAFIRRQPVLPGYARLVLASPPDAQQAHALIAQTRDALVVIVS